MPEILKTSSKQGTDLQPLQIFKTMRRVLYCMLGIDNSVKCFLRKFMVPSSQELEIDVPCKLM